MGKVPSTDIKGMQSKRKAPDNHANDVGFQTTGYLENTQTEVGDSAKFNMMPPGMDIDNQKDIQIFPMTLKKITAMDYPGDGWEGARDIPE